MSGNSSSHPSSQRFRSMERNKHVWPWRPCMALAIFLDDHGTWMEHGEETGHVVMVPRVETGQKLLDSTLAIFRNSSNQFDGDFTRLPLVPNHQSAPDSEAAWPWARWLQGPWWHWVCLKASAARTTRCTAGSMMMPCEFCLELKGCSSATVLRKWFSQWCPICFVNS